MYCSHANLKEKERAFDFCQIVLRLRLVFEIILFVLFLLNSYFLQLFFNYEIGDTISEGIFGQSSIHRVAYTKIK